MADVLSQSQIDALLKQMTTEGEESVLEDPKFLVKEYDFRTPKRFTKEQLKIVDGIYQNYSRRLASYFSATMRVFCEAEVVQIEEQKYYEFNNALPDSVLMVNMNIHYPSDPELEDQYLALEMSRPISFSIIDRLLGGSGLGYEITRDYTEIELAILENVTRQMVSLLQEPWSAYVDMEPRVTKLETNARLLQEIDSDEVVVIIMLRLKIAEIEGFVTVCMPAGSLIAILKLLNERGNRSKKVLQASDEVSRESIFLSVKDSQLDIVAKLGSTSLELNDVLNLRLGDVIKLDQEVDTPVSLMIDNVPWFSGALGTRKGNKAVKILNYYEK